MDVDVTELVVVDNFEQHRAFVLVEPFGGLINVVIGAFVRAANDHDGYTVIVDAVIVDGRFEHVRVF